MQEPLNEKISLLIDDELDSEQALSLLKTVQDDDELKAKLQRYQLVSQVLKNEECYILDSEFADKIHRQVREEPIYFMPRKKVGIDWQKAGLAVAASIALAVVWGVNKVDKQMNPYKEPEVALAVPQQSQPDEMNDRFNDYLQAHDNAVYVNSAPRVQPYARVVGFQQE
jgi:sigma-E factor negative regulatory protein RseA